MWSLRDTQLLYFSVFATTHVFSDFIVRLEQRKQRLFTRPRLLKFDNRNPPKKRLSTEIEVTCLKTVLKAVQN